jgi:hypothetical protein
LEWIRKELRRRLGSESQHLISQAVPLIGGTKVKKAGRKVVWENHLTSYHEMRQD